MGFLSLIPPTTAPASAALELESLPPPPSTVTATAAAAAAAETDFTPTTPRIVTVTAKAAESAWRASELPLAVMASVTAAQDCLLTLPIPVLVKLSPARRKALSTSTTCREEFMIYDLRFAILRRVA